MNKERMELYEDRAVRQKYHKFCYSLSQRISNGIEHFFYRLGIHIAKKPQRWMLGCIVIMLICMSGLFFFRQEKDPMKIWVPPNSDFVADTEWIMSHYKEALRTETFLLTDNNVLEQQTLIKLNEITKQIISVQTSVDKISWSDICVKVPVVSAYMNRQKRQSSPNDFFDDDLISKMNKTTFEPVIEFNSKLYCDILNSLPKACLMFNILDIWNFNSTEIEKDSTEEIITKINTVKVSPTLGHPMNFSELLGGVTLDERGWIVAATSIKTKLMVLVNFLDVDINKVGNSAGTADWASEDVLNWELAFLETATNISNKLQSQKNENNSLTLYYEAGRSYGDISGMSIFQDIDKLIVAVFLMFVYVLTILSNRNWVELRFCLTATGLACVGIAFILAVGVCSMIGIPYGPVHTALPFLLLGLGIDDIFVIVASWKRIHINESNLNKPLTERIGLALGHAGSAITVTSFTDIVAFCISASTILPTLRSFCIYAAVAILMTYLLTITFFISCFTFDAIRINKKKNGMLPCIVHENFTLKPKNPSSTFSWKFINFLYSRIILTTYGKVIIVTITIILTSIGIVGTLQLKQWFDPTWFLPKESYLSQYLTINSQDFTDYGIEGFVLMGDDIDYPSELSKIISLTERLKNTSFIQSLEPWPIDFAKFVSTYYDIDLKTTKLVEDDFHNYLSKFLVSRSGGMYQKNFVFNGTFICGEKTPRISIATINFKYKHFAGPDEWLPGMDNSKRITSEMQIRGYVIVWSVMFVPWISNRFIGQELLRNLTLALICVMATTAILIAELQTCFWILCCILLTLTNVCGFMYFWGMSIDMVSCIALQLAVGLSVDYAAHVAHAFLNTELQENDKDFRRAQTMIAVRHISAAVAYGAGSTLLAVFMLAFSRSHVFLTFCKIFFMVILFGVWYGLIFLPVVLSTIGPRSLRGTQPQPQPMSEKAVMTQDED